MRRQQVVLVWFVSAVVQCPELLCSVPVSG